jgi:hypothetical protein
MPLKQQTHEIIQAAVQEIRENGELFLRVELDYAMALALIGNLQLALRHPNNAGMASRKTRLLIDSLIAQMIARGYNACAFLATCGDNPDFDVEVRDADPS